MKSESRSVKDYKNKSEEDLIKILSKPKPKTSISKKKIKEIKNDFRELRHKFSISKINSFRESFYEIKNQMNLSAPEMRETEKSLIKFEKSLHEFKKHQNYDDNEYGKIRGIRSLFNHLDKDYYKPIKTITSSDNKSNYREYKSKGDKDK